jgi:hypothetical protein
MILPAPSIGRPQVLLATHRHVRSQETITAAAPPARTVAAGVGEVACRPVDAALKTEISPSQANWNHGQGGRFPLRPATELWAA